MNPSGSDSTSSNNYLITPSSLQSTPVQSTPVQSAPVQSTPVQSAPVQSTPVQSAPLNVYRVAASEHTTGWIILTAILGLLIVGLLIGWIICVNAENTQPPCQCFGSLGVELGADANALDLCQPNNNSPCIFTVTSLTAANTQCQNLGAICQAFTYDPTLTLSQMKVVNPSTSFASNTANLYVRQVAPIS